MIDFRKILTRAWHIPLELQNPMDLRHPTGHYGRRNFKWEQRRQLSDELREWAFRH